MAMAVFSATLISPISRTNSSSSPPSVSFSASASSFFNHAFTQNSRAAVRIAVPARPIRGGGLSCTCMFGLGVPELVVIAGVAALVFGPKKLPEVGRSIGKTVKSFQQAAKEFESELKKESDSLTTEVTSLQEEGQENNTKASS